MFAFAFPTPESFIGLSDHDPPATASDRLYTGNCHCGRFRFRMTYPRIGCGFVCDCSACDKLAALWLCPRLETFEVTRDDGTLVTYATSVSQYHFCGVCGTVVTGRHSVGPLPNYLLVNIRTLMDVNPFELRMFRVPFSDYEAEAAKPVPRATSDGAIGGSCHCGRVQVDLLVPLDKVEIKEDNCSICVRNAWIGALPSKAQVRISGQEHTRDYQYGRKYAGFPFCTTCGMHVYLNLYGPSQCELDRLPEPLRQRAMEMMRKNLNIQPINVRVLDGVDRSSLMVKRHDGGTRGYSLGP